MRTATRVSGQDGGHLIPVRYRLEVDHSESDRAISVADQALDTIAESIVNQPRSLQKRIGPSELGMTCAVSLLHKLAGTEEPDRSQIPWKPTIGTAAHAYMEDAFERVNKRGDMPGRYLIEHKVLVGSINGQPITGSCDLYDQAEHTVLDWKFVGKSSMNKYSKSGPSQQYRRQGHLYGKGWEDAGFKPKLVMIAFLPRDGDLEDSFFWSEPYDRQVAVDTLTRVEGLDNEIRWYGLDTALKLHASDDCHDAFCAWHKQGYLNKGAAPTRPAPSNVASLFA